jgi:hypothetical protein
MYSLRVETCSGEGSSKLSDENPAEEEGNHNGGDVDRQKSEDHVLLLGSKINAESEFREDQDIDHHHGHLLLDVHSLIHRALRNTRGRTEQSGPAPAQLLLPQILLGHVHHSESLLELPIGFHISDPQNISRLWIYPDFGI